VNSGFEVVDRFHSLRIEDINAILPTLKPAFDSATDSGFQFRTIRMDRFVDELKIIYQISTAAFRNTFLYDDVSWEEFYKLYCDAKPLIRPELVWFVEDASGRAVGFLFCLIDYYRAVAAMKGGSGVMAKLRFLWNRSSADCVNFKSIAVLPEYRRSKLGGALMCHGYRESLKLGFSKANLCLIRDGNPSSRLDGGNSRILRRYELLQTPGSRLVSTPLG
jgi:GNAT superfamily N-acetyltransferase